MSNSKYEYDDSFEDDLINEFGDKDEEEALSELESELRPKEERLGMQADEDDYIFDQEYLKEYLKNKNKKESNDIYIEEEKKEKKKPVINIQKIISIGMFFIFICIIIDILLIGYKLLYNEKIEVKELLLYTDKPVVYDNTAIIKKPNDHIPIININNSSINDLNNDFNKIYNNYNNANPDYFRYEYSINSDVISIVIIYRNKLDDEKYYSYKFKTYNISLRSLSLLNDEQILRKYNLKLSKVNKLMRDNFYINYEDLLKKNYINESYNYNKLLADLNINVFTDNSNYYIENNKLYAYKPFNIYGNNKISSFFNESNHKIYIK